MHGNPRKTRLACNFSRPLRSAKHETGDADDKTPTKNVQEGEDVKDQTVPGSSEKSVSQAAASSVRPGGTDTDDSLEDAETPLKTVPASVNLTNNEACIENLEEHSSFAMPEKSTQSQVSEYVMSSNERGVQTTFQIEHQDEIQSSGWATWENTRSSKKNIPVPSVKLEPLPYRGDEFSQKQEKDEVTFKNDKETKSKLNNLVDLDGEISESNVKQVYHKQYDQGMVGNTHQVVKDSKSFQSNVQTGYVEDARKHYEAYDLFGTTDMFANFRNSMISNSPIREGHERKVREALLTSAAVLKRTSGENIETLDEQFGHMNLVDGSQTFPPDKETETSEAEDFRQENYASENNGIDSEIAGNQIDDFEEPERIHHFPTCMDHRNSDIGNEKDHLPLPTPNHQTYKNEAEVKPKKSSFDSEVDDVNRHAYSADEMADNLKQDDLPPKLFFPDPESPKDSMDLPSLASPPRCNLSKSPSFEKSKLSEIPNNLEIQTPDDLMPSLASSTGLSSLSKDQVTPSPLESEDSMMSLPSLATMSRSSSSSGESMQLPNANQRHQVPFSGYSFTGLAEPLTSEGTSETKNTTTLDGKIASSSSYNPHLSPVLMEDLSDTDSFRSRTHTMKKSLEMEAFGDDLFVSKTETLQRSRPLEHMGDTQLAMKSNATSTELTCTKLKDNDIKHVHRSQTADTMIVKNSHDVFALRKFEYNEYNTISAPEAMKNIKSQIKHELEQTEKLFVKTCVYDDVLTVLDSENIVFIVGCSGCGKRMVALQLLRDFKEKGFVPLILKDVNEMRQMINPDEKQVIFLRNIFGHIDFDQKKFDDWVHFFDLLELVANAKKKFVFTSKCGIFERGISWLQNTSVFKKEMVIELTRRTISYIDKRCMLIKHCEVACAEISDEVLDLVIKEETTQFFPKCCQLFVKQPNIMQDALKAIEFFSRPIQYYVNIIDSLSNRDDKIPFAILVLTMIFGKFHESFLRKDTPQAKTISDILSAIGIHETSNMMVAVQGLVGSHLRKYEDGYVFIDDCMYDAVGCVFGKKCPECLLKSCSLNFLCEKVKICIEDLSEISIVKVEDSLFDNLSKRFVLELRNGNVHIVSLHMALTNDRFVKHFTKYCEQLDNFQAVILSADNIHSLPFIYWCTWNKTEYIFKWIFNQLRKAKIRIRSELMRQIVKSCGASGNVQVLKLIFDCLKREHVSKLVKDKEPTTICVPPCGPYLDCSSFDLIKVTGILQTACSYGNLDIVKLLITEYKVLQATNDRDIFEERYSLVSSAARNGHADVLEFLIDFGVKVSQVRQGHDTCLHDACVSGDAQVVKVLLRACPKLLEVPGKEPELRLPIHVAVLNKKQELVQLLLQKEANPNAADANMNTAFHVACMKRGNLAILKLLGKTSNPGINRLNKHERTCLHYAAITGDVAMVGFLKAKGACINAMDMKRQTPLHMACMQGHLKIVEKLLDYDADMFICDIKGLPALRYAKCEEIKLKLKLKISGVNEMADD